MPLFPTRKPDNYNRNYLLWLTHFVNRGAGQAPLPGYVVRNGTLVNADFAGVPGTTYGVYDQISRPDSSADSYYVSFDADWKASDKLTFKGQVGTSKGTGETPTQDVAEWNTGIGAGGGYGLNGVGAADWYIGGDPSSQAADTLGWIFGYQDVKIEDEEKWGQIDGEYFIDSGAMTSLQFGARYAEHEPRIQLGDWPGPRLHRCQWQRGAMRLVTAILVPGGHHLARRPGQLSGQHAQLSGRYRQRPGW